MNFEFSLVGLVFLVMLFVPNMLWNYHKPINYDSQNENGILLILECIGEVFAVIFSLFCGNDFSQILIVSVILMILYEMYWIRYFRGNHTLSDMYGNFLSIPLPGATLPVVAFFFLGIASNNFFLILASIILGIGHIGIHYKHSLSI